jgi:hypothetical protein
VGLDPDELGGLLDPFDGNGSKVWEEGVKNLMVTCTI